MYNVLSFVPLRFSGTAPPRRRETMRLGTEYVSLSSYVRRIRVFSMNCGLAKRGRRNDCVQFAAYANEVLWPSFSISGERCAYWGRVFAVTSV